MKRIQMKWRVGIALLLFATSAVAQDPLSVLACEPEWAALTRALGGDRVEVVSATTARQDPHHIQARPSLIAKARRADLLVCTGAELEIGWLPLLLRKSGNGRIQPGQDGHFMAAEQVVLLGKPARLDRSEGDVHAAGNPHVHLDPRRVSSIASALSDRLQRMDSAHASVYRAQLDVFQQNWKRQLTEWEQRAAVLKGKRVVVNHNSWLYLTEWLGMQQVANLEPKPGLPPTSRHLAEVLKTLQNQPADMIVHADYQSDQAAQWVAEKTGIPIRALPFTAEDGETLDQWLARLMTALLGSDS